MAAPLNPNAIQTINNYFKIIHNKGLVPPLPWGSSLIPDNFQVNNPCQLMQDELQAILDHLYSTYSNYQETATALQVITSSTIFPIKLASPSNGYLLNSADNLMNAVVLPTIRATQRGTIKKSILRSLASEIITPKTHQKLDPLLCTLSVEKNNFTQDNLQQLFDVFIEQSTQLSININATFPIFLGTAQSSETNLEDALFYAITSKSKNSSILLETPTPSLLNLSVATIALNSNAGTTNPNLNKVASSIRITESNEKPNPRPLGDPMLTELSAQNTAKNPMEIIAPKRAMIIETHDFSFWKCCRTKQKLIHYTGTKEDEEAAKILVSSRAYYVNLRDNTNQAAIYSGLIIGTLVTLLEAIRQTSINKPSLGRGLDLTLLIVPVLLGLISKICQNIASSTQEKIDRTDRLLKDMDIDIEASESDNVKPLSESYRPFSSARISP